MALIKTYFSHDINSLADPKIVIMINLHGVISYAWWWMLLEKLAEAPDYKLPCNRFTFLGLSIVMDIRPETLVFSKCLANAKQTEANAKQNQANLANNIKENNIKDIEREIRAREDDDPISAFDDPPVSKNKKVYELYMKKVSEISPVIKERLDDLVEVYGVDSVVVAINTTHEAGGNSIKYVETVAAGNLKKEVNKANGNDRRGGGNRKNKAATDGSEVDWSKETGEWL